MKKRSAYSLQKYYEVDDFYRFICETWLSGGRRRAIELFHELKIEDAKDFMVTLLYGDKYASEFNMESEPVDIRWQHNLLCEIIRSLKSI